MSVRDLIVVRILLLVARMFADDATAVEIKHLANHISQERGLLEAARDRETAT